MFSKANIISTLATAVWAYFGGWVLWGMIADPMLLDHLGSATGVMREMPDTPHLIIGCLIVGFLFSTIYGKWGSPDYGISSGLGYGVLTGLMIGLGIGMIDLAVMNILDITGTLISAVTYVVFLGIMGLVAGLVYSKTSGSSA